MWKCQQCSEEVEDTFDSCWNCGTEKDGTPPKDPSSFQNVEASVEMTTPHSAGEEPTTVSRQNRIERIRLAGGLIGMLSSSPRLALQRKIDEVNSQGWYVRQVIDDSTGNLFVYILRFVILILTLFLYTPANGYFIILEREVRRD